MSEKPIRERDIKTYFLRQADRHGAEVRKCEWYMRKDAPDWFVALNGAHFVELKRPGKDFRESQKREAEKLALKGVTVHLLDNHEAVDNSFKRIGMKHLHFTW